jgi:glycosyltransferase involved in cell wall biosynthesis
MRILVCHNFYAQEGGENGVFRQEVKILEERGHEVFTFTRNSAEITHFSAFAKLRMLVEGFHSLSVDRELRRIVQEFRPDVALVQNVFPLISPGAYTVLEHLGVPIVQLVFNYRFLCANAQLFVNGARCERCVCGSPLQAAMFRCLHQSTLPSLWYGLILAFHRHRQTLTRCIQRFIVPHPFVGSKLVEGGIDPARIRVVGNPYALPPVALEEGEEPYVIYVGRVVPEKGVIDLVRAIERVPPPLKLVIVGDGEALPEIEEYLTSRPALAARVDRKGRVFGDAVQALMAHAIAFVLPSLWHDVSPLLLYNALAMGKPAIGSHLGSQPDILSDGVDGFIYPAGDVDQLAAKLVLLAGDAALRRRMGAAGRRKAEARFSTDVHYANLMAVLEEVTGGVH